MDRPQEMRLSRADRLTLMDHGHQTQAHLSLLHFLRLTAPFPVTDSYAASPDLLLYLANMITMTRPALVVECGSGVSTLVMARTAQLQSRTTRIVSLEHEPQYADRTRELLELHDVQAFAEVRYVPLRPTSLPGHETPWYASDQTADLNGISLLLVDGPPTTTGPSARYPAVPILHDRLSECAIVLLDDAGRKDEAGVAERWQSEQLRDFERADLEMSRGLAQFSRSQRT